MACQDEVHPQKILAFFVIFLISFDFLSNRQSESGKRYFILAQVYTGTGGTFGVQVKSQPYVAPPPTPPPVAAPRIQFRSRVYADFLNVDSYSGPDDLDFDITVNNLQSTNWIRDGDQLIQDRTNLCLTRVLPGDNPADYDVDLKTCAGGSDQRWEITTVSSPWRWIRNPGQDCLDIFSGGTHPYDVDCIDCDSSNEDQHWEQL